MVTASWEKLHTKIVCTVAVDEVYPQRIPKHAKAIPVLAVGILCLRYYVTTQKNLDVYEVRPLYQSAASLGVFVFLFFDDVGGSLSGASRFFCPVLGGASGTTN